MSSVPLKRESGYKGTTFLFNHQIFRGKIFKPPQQPLGAVAPSAFASAKVETFILSTKFFRDFFYAVKHIFYSTQPQQPDSLAIEQ